MNLVGYSSSSDSESDDEPLDVKKRRLDKLRKKNALDIESFLPEPKNQGPIPTSDRHEDQSKQTSEKSRSLGKDSNKFNGLEVASELAPITSSLTNTSFVPSTLLRRKKSQVQPSSDDIPEQDIYKIPENELNDETPQTKTAEKPHSSASNIVEFNIGDFYESNKEIERVEQVKLKQFNAHGKNQLSELIRFAKDEENSKALEQKFAKEKLSAKRKREKYGW